MVQNAIPVTCVSRCVRDIFSAVIRIPMIAAHRRGCATAVMIDPATGNRIAAADPRRDCYAIAY